MPSDKLIFNTQPSSLSMNYDCHGDEYESHEKVAHQRRCHCELSHARTDHEPCHNARLRRFWLLAVVIFLGLVVVLAFACFADASPSDIVKGLVSRATDPNQDTFVNRKFYLIVVFVGLFVVIILAIMLSAWCCRGVFENPLCCPCYLCACCGGLACLECIGCGLCAEGISEM